MKRLALTKEGNLTYCSASEENIGKGRCNHIAHQEVNESSNDFIKRIENCNNIKISYNVNKNKFNSSSLNKLYDYIKNSGDEYAEDDLKFIDERLDKIYDYFNYKQETEDKMFKLMLTKERSQNDNFKIEQIDQLRRAKHDVAINSVNQINRLCEQYDIDLFYNGSDNRKDISDAINNFLSVDEDLIDSNEKMDLYNSMGYYNVYRPKDFIEW